VSNSEAQQIIADQAKEIERLKRLLENERFSQELSQALALAAATGTISLPVTHAHLLEMIVAAAAQVISAHAASLFLIDQETQELVFEVALGQKAAQVKEFRIPMGHGIAGLVAMSGQPMAVSDAQKDMRQASDIAFAVGYLPHSILCVPLFYNDQIIGVLELLDKEGANSFSSLDMQILGLFANQAAVAIEQSLTHRNLAALLSEVIDSLDNVSNYQKEHLKQKTKDFASSIEEDKTYQQALEIARLVQEIVWQGEGEAQTCHSILRSFAEYLRLKSKLSSNLGAW
jgi:GAF domain-containing protein